MLRICGGGGELSRDSRCPTCRQTANADRGTTKQRGYGGQWKRISARVIARANGICHYCGGVATTTDHVVPLSLGGTNHMTNLVASCRPWNSGKRDRVA